MIEVFYYSPRGASIGRVIANETELVTFVSKLRKPANIRVSGELIGRVWKQDKKWVWFYDPELLTKAATS